MRVIWARGRVEAEKYEAGTTAMSLSSPSPLEHFSSARRQAEYFCALTVSLGPGCYYLHLTDEEIGSEAPGPCDPRPLFLIPLSFASCTVLVHLAFTELEGPGVGSSCAGLGLLSSGAPGETPSLLH